VFSRIKAILHFAHRGEFGVILLQMKQQQGEKVRTLQVGRFESMADELAQRRRDCGGSPSNASRATLVSQFPGWWLHGPVTAHVKGKSPRLG